MTDKKMLELAAKAAGYNIVDNSHPVSLYIAIEGCKGGARWNPLSDDGDALRLAIKLKMLVDTIGNVIIGSLPSVCVEFDFDEQSACPLSAVRRAIVRAAAEVGKNMK